MREIYVSDIEVDKSKNEILPIQLQNKIIKI